MSKNGLIVLGSRMGVVGSLGFSASWLLITWRLPPAISDLYIVGVTLACLVAVRARSEWVLLVGGLLLVFPFGLYLLGSPSVRTVGAGLLSVAVVVAAMLVAVGKH